MMSKPKIYLREAIYIPVQYLDTDQVEEAYTKHMYDDKICRTCDYKRERHSSACDECELGGYKGVTKFAGYKNINGERFMSLPIGDRLNIEEKTGITLKRFKIVDKRTKVPFEYKVKFTGQLRSYQIPMKDDWITAEHGLIKAPPRTGKTVTTIAIAIELGMRAVIIADQTDFLDNFIEEMEAYTNLPKLQEKAGKKLFGYLKKPEDYKTVQIGVITYQSLISDKNGRQRLKWINKNFGTIFVDECFTGDHRVMTDLGLLRLDDIVEGRVFPKKVLSKNLDTGIKEFKLIESFTKKSVTRLCKIHTDEGIISCTPTHLIWSNSRNDYVQAQHLTPDDDLDLTK